MTSNLLRYAADALEMLRQFDHLGDDVGDLADELESAIDEEVDAFASPAPPVSQSAKGDAAPTGDAVRDTAVWLERRNPNDPNEGYVVKWSGRAPRHGERFVPEGDAPAGDALQEAIDDLVSHRGDWRMACEVALRVQGCDAQEDALYWKHQIATLDRIDAALAAPPAPAGRDADTTCRCGAPCRKEVLPRGGDNGWGDDESRTVLRYVPPAHSRKTMTEAKCGAVDAAIAELRRYERELRADGMTVHAHTYAHAAGLVEAARTKDIP